MTVTLALDLGTHMGWALLRQDGQLESGHETFALPKAPVGEGTRFVEFRRWLVDVKASNEQLGRIVYERVHHVGDGQAYAAQLYGGFLAVLMMFGEHHRIPYDGFQIAHIKKTWTGKGNADKNAMIARCRELGFKPETSDEADAIAVLHVALDRAPPLPLERQAEIMRSKRPKPRRDTATGAIPFDPF